MTIGRPLPDYLSHETGRTPLGEALREVIDRLAMTAIALADLVALGPLAGDLAQSVGPGGGGDVQKLLDLRAHAMFRSALRGASVAAFVSEEAVDAEVLDPNGRLGVALDPLDGSGGLDANAPVGTIFSVVAHEGPAATRADARFAWPLGAGQLAAGFFLYGPQTTLALTVRDTVDLFTLDRRQGVFRQSAQAVRLPPDRGDIYAINGSNYRHWEEPVRAFVDDCLAGTSGHYGVEFNTRWHGVLVAEAQRILGRGGIYLYPGDARDGYRDGRLRLVYEAYPMALLLERAGGAASTGRRRILDVEASSVHQRVPLIFGSRAMVERLEALHHRPGLWPPTSAPLFASRGLFRT